MRVEVIGGCKGSRVEEVSKEDLRCLCRHRDPDGDCSRAQLFVSFPGQKPRECNPDENSFCQPYVSHEDLVG